MAGMDLKVRVQHSIVLPKLGHMNCPIAPRYRQLGSWSPVSQQFSTHAQHDIFRCAVCGMSFRFCNYMVIQLKKLKDGMAVPSPFPIRFLGKSIR